MAWLAGPLDALAAIFLGAAALGRCHRVRSCRQENTFQTGFGLDLLLWLRFAALMALCSDFLPVRSGNWPEYSFKYRELAQRSRLRYSAKENMKNLYALLVGINDYPSPVRSLRGCVSDVKAFEQYLYRRMDQKEWNLRVRVLMNEEATRDAVIDSFRRHLCQADDGDSAVLLFSGHGSQQPSPPEYWTSEPDRLDETIVCYDSRLPGGRDLADKELAALVQEASSQGSHVVVILDCCHSGSGTRAVGELEVRTVPPRFDVRPLSSYLGHGNDALRFRRAGASGWELGADRHVLLASCRDNELAWEQTVADGVRGLFCLSLTETLDEHPLPPTYRSLFQGVQARVMSRRAGQNPQLEATLSADLDLAFLGGGAARNQFRLSVTVRGTTGWIVNFGSIHGMPEPNASDPLRFLLARQRRKAQNGDEPAPAIGTAKVMAVHPDFSSVELDFDPGQAREFDAAPLNLSTLATRVAFLGEPDGVGAASYEMQHSGPGNGPSPFLIEDRDNPSFLVQAFEDRYVILRQGEAIPLTIVRRNSSWATRMVIDRLEHIAGWYQVATGLTNPCSSISDLDFEVSIVEHGAGNGEFNGTVEYREEKRGWTQPGIKIRLANRSHRPLFFALLALSESFKISPLFPTGSIRLETQQEAYVNRGGPLYCSVPDDRANAGITEVVDIIKVIVSTSEFDARLLQRDEMEKASSRGLARNIFSRTNLNVLMHRTQTRELAQAPESLQDWKAMRIAIRTVRPRPWVTVSANADVSLGFGVTVGPHPTLSARIRLSSEMHARRSIGGRLRPALLSESERTKVIQFTSPHGNDPGLAAVEITTPHRSEDVSPKHPIKLFANLPLSAGEHILPFTFDGESYLPLGRSETSDRGTMILIEQLPNVSSAEGVKSSTHNAVQILFEKISARN
jgi:hypothetical protein